jgi:pimeloyl-ACP methyl ester carboxylesterase
MFRLLASALVFMMSTLSSMAAPSANPTTATTYKTINVNGLNVFYREAGPANAPTILLLHGFPSSSRMFDTLMPLLADRFHLVAPDYPGFGNSETPAPGKFNYTFDALTDIVGAFTTALHLDHYALYVQDYGGPVGYRLAVAHPERVTALIVQNAIAHEEGLGRLADQRTGFFLPTAPQTKRSTAHSLLRSRRRNSVISAPHRIPNATTPIYGWTKPRSWPDRARLISSRTCSMTTEIILPHTRRGRRGCANAIRRP